MQDPHSEWVSFLRGPLEPGEQWGVGVPNQEIPGCPQSRMPRSRWL